MHCGMSVNQRLHILLYGAESEELFTRHACLKVTNLMHTVYKHCSTSAQLVAIRLVHEAV